MSILESSYSEDVFVSVLTRHVSIADPAHGALVHLGWSAPDQEDRFVQIYVDGRWYDVVIDPTQREHWLILTPGIQHRITLLAVSPDLAYIGHAALLTDWPTLADHAQVALLRDQTLPVDARVVIQPEGRPAQTADLFGPEADRSGFGAVFGQGDFGFDASVGPGMGMGELGYGPLGIDAQAWRWITNDLPHGGQTLTLAVHDIHGRAITPSVEREVTIDRSAAPVSSLSLSDDFVLSWS